MNGCVEQALGMSCFVSVSVSVSVCARHRLPPANALALAPSGLTSLHFTSFERDLTLLADTRRW